jgi:hypothetical protein
MFSFQRLPCPVSFVNIRQYIYRSSIVITKSRNKPSFSVVTDRVHKPSGISFVERPPTPSFINLPTVVKSSSDYCMSEMFALSSSIVTQDVVVQHENVVQVNNINFQIIAF